MNKFQLFTKGVSLLFKIPFFLFTKPRKTIDSLAVSLNIKKGYEIEKKEYLKKKYGYNQLPTIDILELFPNFNETVNNFSFLNGTSSVMDIALLKALAKRFENCQYLEIGSWRGESIANVAEIASHCSAITLSEDEMRAKELSEDFIDVHGFFSKNLKNISMYYHDSTTFDFSQLNETFDLIFIDGDHSYETIIKDTQNVLKLLKNENSIIVWHDYGYNSEVVRFSVLAGILDAIPKEYHQKLFHVSNSLCAIYFNWIGTTKFIKFPEKPNKSFDINISAKSI